MKRPRFGDQQLILAGTRALLGWWWFEPRVVYRSREATLNAVQRAVSEKIHSCQVSGVNELETDRNLWKIPALILVFNGTNIFAPSSKILKFISTAWVGVMFGDWTVRMPGKLSRCPKWMTFCGWLNPAKDGDLAFVTCSGRTSANQRDET